MSSLNLPSKQLLINLSFLAAKPTGHSVYAKNLFSALTNLEPTLLTAQSFSNFRCYSIPGNMSPDQGNLGHFTRLLWTQFQLPQIYKKLRSQLLFSPIPEAPLFTNCQHIVTLHDLIPLRFFSRFSPMRLYCQYYVPQVLNQARHIICISEATAKDAVEFFQISLHKMTVTPLGYDDRQFRFLDLPTQNYFLYVGRHNPYKNLARMIQAFAKIASHTDTEFWIAGASDPRYTPTYITQIEQLGLSDRVKFLNYISYDELPILINQAISLVFPTLWEGFGLPVLEAMACGTPVITSNLSSLPEVAGDAALLVDPYNTDEIADAMNTIATQTQLHQQLRQRGLDRVQQFSWRKTATATATILQQYL
jgi:glycosyltransferase involved in cell wall biosynthesis